MLSIKVKACYTLTEAACGQVPELHSTHEKDCIIFATMFLHINGWLTFYIKTVYYGRLKSSRVFSLFAVQCCSYL